MPDPYTTPELTALAVAGLFLFDHLSVITDENNLRAIEDLKEDVGKAISNAALFEPPTDMFGEPEQPLSPGFEPVAPALLRPEAEKFARPPVTWAGVVMAAGGLLALGALVLAAMAIVADRSASVPQPLGSPGASAEALIISMSPAPSRTGSKTPAPPMPHAVSGRVLDGQGAPAPSAVVSVYLMPADGTGTGLIVRTVRADAAGQYTTSELPGHYRLVGDVGSRTGQLLVTISDADQTGKDITVP